ncbi:hypothetical protein ACCT11_36470, partial [Rhizobium johnstonii]|uniref:hypothetical protein n=1 Tax=Rhizobium johnstonii TaxID=3019933 RepID=UPI003F9CC69C
ADHEPLPHAPWEPAYDLDPICVREGKRWNWRVAVTCPWEPTRVLLTLSDGGSDLLRCIEAAFDGLFPLGVEFEQPEK